MYHDWQIERWETPVVDCNRLLLLSLVDAGRELVMIFVARNSKYCVRFSNYQAYRNIDEAYRTDLWHWLDKSNQRCGFTFLVKENPPFHSWGTVYLHTVLPDVRHYVIATDDDAVEVLSTCVPKWEPKMHTSDGDSNAGKSTHLYIGDDDARINELMADIKRENEPN